MSNLYVWEKEKKIYWKLLSGPSDINDTRDMWRHAQWPACTLSCIICSIEIHLGADTRRFVIEMNWRIIERWFFIYLFFFSCFFCLSFS